MNPTPYPHQTTMPDPQDVLEIVDHASTMSDRWLFLAMLVLLLLALFVAIRWIVLYFTKRTDKLEQEIVDVREKHVKYITEEAAKTSSLLDRCLRALERYEKHPLLIFALISSTLYFTGCAVNVPLGENGCYGEVYAGYRVPMQREYFNVLEAPVWKDK
jgi:hypothetical protein